MPQTEQSAGYKPPSAMQFGNVGRTALPQDALILLAERQAADKCPCVGENFTNVQQHRNKWEGEIFTNVLAESVWGDISTWHGFGWLQT